jgi:hypothetical protein
VLDTSRHHEEVARPQRHGLATLHLHPERPIPAQEQLVLVVVMPRELAFEPSQSHDGIVRLDDIDRRPRSGQPGDKLGDRDDLAQRYPSGTGPITSTE